MLCPWWMPCSSSTTWPSCCWSCGSCSPCSLSRWFAPRTESHDTTAWDTWGRCEPLEAALAWSVSCFWGCVIAGSWVFPQKKSSSPSEVTKWNLSAASLSVGEAVPCLRGVLCISVNEKSWCHNFGMVIGQCLMRSLRSFSGLLALSRYWRKMESSPCVAGAGLCIWIVWARHCFGNSPSGHAKHNCSEPPDSRPGHVAGAEGFGAWCSFCH